jgi:hypothetical protein
MKIENDGKPTYGPRSRAQRTQPPKSSNTLFWVGVVVLVIIVLGAL